MKIGFIGLGHMGAPMARNLLKAGFPLGVFDLVLEAVNEAESKGAHGMASVEAIAASEAEAIVTMLPSSPHVRSVYVGSDGILARAKPGTLLVDCSTIDPRTAREVAAEALKKGFPMLDAPVSGGTGGAEAGSLTFMVGGEAKDLEAARPILSAMGKSIVHCGGSGAGQAAKLANNLLLGISMIGVSEAMALGTKLGVKPAVLAQVINSSSGRCWSSDTYNPYPGVLEKAPSSRGFKGGFASDLMLKDLGLAVGAAKAVRQPVILGAAAQQLYQLLSAQGKGGLDFSCVIELYHGLGGDGPV